MHTTYVGADCYRWHDPTIYRDTVPKWECTTNVPSFGPDYMQSQLVGNYSEKLCLSFFPLICYLRQLWHDKRAWKGLEQQINATDMKHLKLSFSAMIATSAHSQNLLVSDSSQKCIWEVSFWYLLIKPSTKIWSSNIRGYLIEESETRRFRPSLNCLLTNF